MKKRRGGRRAESSGKGLLAVLCVVLVLALGTLAYMILRDTGREEPADTQASEEDSQAGSAQREIRISQTSGRPISCSRTG